MIIDSLSQLANKSALSTAATGRAIVGNTLLTGGRDMGAGKPLYLVVQIDTAVLSGGAATVSFEVVSDAQDPVAVDGTATLHSKTMDFPKATLVQGFQFVIPLPSVKPDYEGYLGLIANVGTAALTAGKINAHLTMDPIGWKAYPNENSG